MYGPIKKAWRKVLTEWKSGPGKHYTALQKPWFPQLLFDLLVEMDNRQELAVAGFRGTGIYPLNSDRVISKLKKDDVKPAYDLVSQMVLEHIRELRESAKKPSATTRGKRVSVEPGEICRQQHRNRQLVLVLSVIVLKGSENQRLG